MEEKLLDWIFPDPKPCPKCGETNIYVCFVSWRDRRFLPFWVEMRCSMCGNHTKPKLFHSRALRAWNRQAKPPKNCWECAYAKGCKSWYSGLTCKYKGALERRARV